MVPADLQHPELSHLSDLKYLECVIKEGMRLWPVSAITSFRLASKDIPYNDLIIPKGSFLLIPSYVISRTADIKVSTVTFVNILSLFCMNIIARIPRVSFQIAGWTRIPMAS